MKPRHVNERPYPEIPQGKQRELGFRGISQPEDECLPFSRMETYASAEGGGLRHRVVKEERICSPTIFGPPPGQRNPGRVEDAHLRQTGGLSSSRDRFDKPAGKDTGRSGRTGRNPGRCRKSGGRKGEEREVVVFTCREGFIRLLDPEAGPAADRGTQVDPPDRRRRRGGPARPGTRPSAHQVAERHHRKRQKAGGNPHPGKHGGRCPRLRSCRTGGKRQHSGGGISRRPPGQRDIAFDRDGGDPPEDRHA